MSLLADPDPRVVSTCRRQVLDWGAEAIPVLRNAARSAEPRLRVRARALLETLALGAWSDRVDRFARACRQRPAAADPTVLETGALLLSSLGRVEVDIDGDRIAMALQSHADLLRRRVRGWTAASCARGLGALLHDEVGYRGGGVSHYALENLALDRVIETRRGVGAALGIVYILVGRRVGLRMTGVAVPGRFLVRVHGARPVLVDPATGKPLTKSDCLRDLRSRGYGQSGSSCLEDLDDQRILLFLLDDLRRVIGYREDVETLRAVLRVRAMLATML